MEHEPFTSQSTQKSDRVARYIALSILIHLLLAVLGLLYVRSEFNQALDPPKERPKERMIDLNLLPTPPKQIVDIPKPEQESIPDDAKNAALYNQRVKDETTARSVNQTGSSPKPTRSTQKRSAARAPSPQTQDTSKQKPRASSAESDQKTEPDTKPEAPVGWGQTPRVKRDQARDESTLPSKTDTQTRKTNDDDFPERASKNNASLDARFGEPSASSDVLPDYKIGSHTYVNALRYPDVSYFVELKRRFRTAFNPYSIRGVLRKHAAQLSAMGSIQTVMAVTVDARGNLTDLFVIRKSAIGDYDLFVQKVIQDSAPFTSPPAKLLDKDGKLRMSWTFQVTF